MSSLFSATRGPCKIEITTADGEKFSYNAVVTQHEISIGPSSQIHSLGGGIVEEWVSSRNKEVTLKFIECSPSPKTFVKSKSKPQMKGLDQQLRESIENEEML